MDLDVLEIRRDSPRILVNRNDVLEMIDVDSYPRIMSLCTGGGGLDLGLRLVLPGAQCVCYVEIEGFAISHLVEKIQNGEMDDAPVWSDLRTFHGSAWSGKVDLITGGYPCQPFSLAGQRSGTDDPRHLFPKIAEIVEQVEPEWCFFENVPGHITMGFPEVRDRLEGMGYRVEAGVFSADEVGAPHERKRLFILAHRERLREQQSEGIQRKFRGRSGNRCGKLGDNSTSGLHRDRRRKNRKVAAERCEELADVESERFQTCGKTRTDKTAITGSECFIGKLADVESVTSGRLSKRTETDYSRSIIASCPVFAPGMDDWESWVRVLPQMPELIPAMADDPDWKTRQARKSSQESVAPWQTTESIVRRMDDGMALRVDRIRMLGNGVVPIVAAKAFLSLVSMFRSDDG